VPFTCEIGGDGLLSRGIDPPPGVESASWRAWVTKRLAASLATHAASGCEDPVAEALVDMRTAGIDPERWLPRVDAFWIEQAT
jgi:hypothetical protein